MLISMKLVEYKIIGKLSESLTRSRRCMGGVAFYKVTGNLGRQNAMLMPESEDLPCA